MLYVVLQAIAGDRDLPLAIAPIGESFGISVDIHEYARIRWEHPVVTLVVSRNLHVYSRL